jgi:hypothetical protein
MKQTQVIFLTFATGQSTTTARINVPFKVKTLHTKALSLTTGNAALTTGEYVTIESDLVGNSPLGSTFNISSYSANCSQDIENQYWNPRVVQGEYTFVMKKSSGALYPASTGGDSVAIVIEFNGPDEMI